MKDYNDAFRDIPGTTIFDAMQSRRGFHLNQFCMSLMKPENRAAFKADEAAYLARFPLTDEQREAVLARDYNRMIALGGNIYFLAKIGATDGFSFQNLASKMTGMSEEAYREMMLAGGPLAGGQPQRLEGKLTWHASPQASPARMSLRSARRSTTVARATTTGGRSSPASRQARRGCGSTRRMS